MIQKVSILVPCYNGEKYIKRCFDSILKQSYQNIELIIINDGSKDNSEKLILSYEERFINKGYEFVYIKKENGGVGSAIKKGLEKVTGDYFMTLDIDDYILESAVQTMAGFLSGNEYKLVRCNGYYVDEENLNSDNNLFINENINKNIFEDLIYARTNNWAGSYMIDTKEFFKITKDIEFYESRHGQNLQILLPMSYSHKAGFINKPLVKYVKCKGSYTDVNSLNTRIEMYDNFKNIRIEILKRMNVLSDDVSHNLEVEYLRTYLGLCLLYRDKKYGRIFFERIRNISKLNKTDIITYLCIKFKTIDNLRKIIR